MISKHTPTERLAGFVDFFLQTGMKNLDTFLQDTKHTLQVIEKLNEQVHDGSLLRTCIRIRLKPWALKLARSF